MNLSCFPAVLRWAVAAVCLVAAATPARAQCPYNILFEELGDRLAEIRFETDSPGSGTRARVRLGEDPADLGGALHPLAPGSWASTPPLSVITTRRRALAGLAPSSTYFFDVQVTTAADTNTFGDWDLCEAQHCPSVGAQPGGYECVQVGARLRPRFTTLPAEGTPPLSPIPPTNLPMSDLPPAPTGSVFTVTLDEEGLCTNLQAQLAAAGAANPSLIHEVVVPGGGVCRPESEGRLSYDLPQKSGPGEVIVRCDADPLLLPPPGIRMDPAFRSPLACAIESNLGDINDNSRALIGVISSGCPPDAPCTEGWRFVGFRIAIKDHRKLVRNLWPIVDFDPGDGRITVTGDLRGKAGLDGLQVNIPGIQDTYAHRSCLNRGVTYSAASNTSSFLCGGGAVGTYTGGGYVSDRMSTPLADCEAGPDPICETAEPHPYGNYFEYPLQSVTGNTAQTVGTHRLTNFLGIQIMGATGDCNGFYTITTQNRVQGTVVLQPAPAGSCTGGILREVGPVAVFGTMGGGAAEANNVHILDVIDSTHIRLLGSTLSQPTVGGWMAVDPPVLQRIGNFGGCARCRLDRVLVYGGGKAARLRLGFSWDRAKNATYANHGAVIHSWMQDLSDWFPVHPVTKEAGRSSEFSVLSTTPVIYSITNAKDVQLRNNGNFSTPGIPIFAQSGHETCAEDISIDRGLFYLPLSAIGGRPEAEGRYYPSRHFLEFKCVRRALIRGLDLRHNPANSQPSGAVISLSITNDIVLEPPGATAMDVNVELNTLWDNGGGIDIVGPASRVSSTQSARRIRVADTLARVNRSEWLTTPSGQSGEVSQPWGTAPFYGMFVRDTTPSTDIIVERNTVSELMGGDSSFLALGGQYGGTAVFRQNVFPYSRRFFGGLNGSGAPYEPPSGNRGFTGWLNHFRRGSVTPDPFSQWDNVAIPCVADTIAASMEAEMKKVNNMATDAASDFSCSGGCPANFNTEIIGGANQTCLTRQAAFFKERMDYGKPAATDFPGYGVDVEELRDAMGVVRDLTVEIVFETNARITYRAPDSAACYVDYGFDKLFWAPEFDRVSDGGGPVNRQVDLPGLQGNTTYHFRLLCSADQPRGVFTTGFGPAI